MNRIIRYHTQSFAFSFACHKEEKNNEVTMSGIDSNHFLDFTTRATMKAWGKRDARACKQAIPWTPMTRPLNQSKVALVSTAGIARIDDIPFDQQGEYRNPWWGDPSYRVISRESTEKDVKLYHMHIDCETGEKISTSFFPHDDSMNL